MVAQTDAVILVFGDSTGNERGEWVGLWAETLADDGATVTLPQWDWDADSWGASPVTVGDRARKVTIWNASQPEATAAYPLEHLEIFPKSANLVNTKYGHNGSTSIMKSTLRALLDSIQERWGAVPR